jgi:hypothetical protein
MASLLPSVWKVPPQFVARLGDQVGRQRAMFADGNLLLILHAPPGPEDDSRQGRFFWRKEDNTWSSDCFGAGPGALGRHLEEFSKAVEQLEKQDDAARSAGDYFQVMQAAAPLQRAARNLHQALQQAREMLPEDRDLIRFRDQAYSIERMAELLHEGVKNGLEFAMARQSEAQSRAAHQMTVASHRLNVLAAFFFPVATLMAIFGANLKHGFEDMPAPWPIASVLGVGLVCGAILALFISRPTGGQ